MIDIEKLNALVDGELDAREKAEVEALVASDPEAAREIQSLSSLKRALAAQAKPVEDEAAWKACVGRLNEIDRSRSVERIVSKYAYAFCSVLFLLIVGAGLLNRAGYGSRIGANDVAQVGAANMSLFGPPDNLDSWLVKEIGTAPTRIPLRVVKCGSGNLNGHRFAKLVLADGKGEMELIIVPGVDGLEGADPMDERYSTTQVEDTNIVAWNESELLLILVGERGARDLRTVAEQIR